MLREEGSGQQATFVELFFDLVMVFALTRLVEQAVPGFDSHSFSERWANIGRTLLLFAPLLWLWTMTAYITSRFEPRRAGTQLVVLGSALGLLIMGTAIPQAFGRDGLAFALPFVVVQVTRVAVIAFGLGSHSLRRLYSRILVWFCIAAVGWIAGALTDSGARVALWTAAVVLDLGAARLGWPVPGLGQGRATVWQAGGHHLADRYPQFLLIALGESILAVGSVYTSGPRALYETLGLLVAFATTVLLWRIYFFRAGALLGEALDKCHHPASWGRHVGFSHALMVLGIVATAIGFDLVQHQHTSYTYPPWLTMITGGPVIFLAGRARLEYLVFTRVSRRRIIGITLLLIPTPLLSHTPPLTAASLAALALLLVAALDKRHARQRPPEHPNPAG
ncbi:MULTISPECIES: low temperature requirement protein A [unclassified Micromonospora]|uniref:low temperature requirement protein A n=1 Tax=unclassified Micromonospora TaxID=2617518 RepID=UPI003333BFBC